MLSAISQICSMMDPLIFRHVIDDYATKHDKYTQAQFIHGAGLLLLAIVGIVFIARVAKNFRTISRTSSCRRSARRCIRTACGILSICLIKYSKTSAAEDSRQTAKVRQDVEKFVTLAINVVFTTLIAWCL